MPFVDRAVVFTRPLRMSSDEIPPYLSRFMIALSRASAILDLSLRSCQGGEDMGGVKGKRRFVRSRSGFCVCVAARGATTFATGCPNEAIRASQAEDALTATRFDDFCRTLIPWSRPLGSL